MEKNAFRAIQTLRQSSWGAGHQKRGVLPRVNLAAAWLEWEETPMPLAATLPTELRIENPCRNIRTRQLSPRKDTGADEAAPIFSVHMRRGS